MKSHLEWNFMHTSLPPAPFGNVMQSLFVSQKNPRNISITRRLGSTPGFLYSYLYLFCTEFSPSDPFLPAPLPLSDLLRPLFFCAGIST